MCNTRSKQPCTINQHSTIFKPEKIPWIILLDRTMYNTAHWWSVEAQPQNMLAGPELPNPYSDHAGRPRTAKPIPRTCWQAQNYQTHPQNMLAGPELPDPSSEHAVRPRTAKPILRTCWQAQNCQTHPQNMLAGPKLPNPSSEHASRPRTTNPSSEHPQN